MAKKRGFKKENCEFHGHCHCKVFFMTFAAIAFLLFLLTVWPGLSLALLTIHWAWYLGLTVLLVILALSENCWCSKK
jgi:hypothetical protein